MKQLRPLVAVGDAVFFLPPGASAPLDALVTHVHTQHLVDLEVSQEDSWRRVPLVPFLCDGEPDPGSPPGLCQPHATRAAPGPVVLNAGTDHEFSIDPATGAKL